MADIFARYAAGKYSQFMLLDVEGYEQKILRSIDFSAWSPLVICCETLSFSPTGDGKKDLALIEYLKSQGYLVCADTYINTIFVDQERWRIRRV